VDEEKAVQLDVISGNEMRFLYGASSTLVMNIESIGRTVASHVRSRKRSVNLCGTPVATFEATSSGNDIWPIALKQKRRR